MGRIGFITITFPRENSRNFKKPRNFESEIKL